MCLIRGGNHPRRVASHSDPNQPRVRKYTWLNSASPPFSKQDPTLRLRVVESFQSRVSRPGSSKKLLPVRKHRGSFKSAPILLWWRQNISSHVPQSVSHISHIIEFKLQSAAQSNSYRGMRPDWSRFEAAAGFIFCSGLEMVWIQLWQILTAASVCQSELRTVEENKLRRSCHDAVNEVKSNSWSVSTVSVSASVCVWGFDVSLYSSGFQGSRVVVWPVARIRSVLSVQGNSCVPNTKWTNTLDRTE